MHAKQQPGQKGGGGGGGKKRKKEEKTIAKTLCGKKAEAGVEKWTMKRGKGGKGERKKDAGCVYGGGREYL